jgi:hypothetical protein
MKTLYFVLSVFLLMFYTTSCNKLIKTRVVVSVTERGSGKPVEGAEVILLEGSPGGIMSSLPSWSIIDRKNTDASGLCFFEFHAANNSSHDLKAYHPDYYDELAGSDSKSLIKRKRNYKSFKLPPNAWIKVHTVNVNKTHGTIEVEPFGTPGGGGGGDFMGIMLIHLPLLNLLVIGKNM